MTARTRPFSNGSEYSDWTERNCKAGCLLYSGSDKAPLCDLDRALGVAYLTDGTISDEAARRLGCLDTGLGYPNRDCPEKVA